MIKSIWYGNAAIVLIAILVLFFGLPNLGDIPTDSTLVTGEPGSDGAAGTTGSVTDSQGNLVESALVSVTRKYSERWKPPAGSVQINLAPSDVDSDQARWRVDGGAWQASNAIVSELPIGPHRISFKPLSEWIKPLDMTLNVARKKTTTAKGEYKAIEKGSIRVIIVPEELLELKPQWRVDNNPWQNSGATVEGILVGRHAITFKDLPDWNIPEPINAVVTHEQLTEATGTYVLKPVGSLTVTLGPETVLDAQAEWKLDNGPWQKSDATINKIAVGRHRVQAKQISEWWQPDSIDVEITEDETTVASINYEPVLYGSVLVKIIPEAAAQSGIQWRIDQNPLQGSGLIDDRVIAGQAHKLQFIPTPDWEPVDSVDVELIEGQLARYTVEFTQKTPPPPVGLTIKTTLAFTGKPLLGSAWIKTLSDKGYKLYFVGEEIAEYKIESITPGQVHFSKRGFKYILNVPLPQVGVEPTGVAPPETDEQGRGRGELPPGERGGRRRNPIRPPGSDGKPIR
ncbi:MAG: hypothetical protein GY869_26340 [Planctomycetes bacterium]|nr:hypothetical protein [Planctomycetota bacterium]